MDLPQEVWEAILSFCDANSLCELDLANGAFFLDITDSCFAQLAFRRFGLSSPPNEGKKTWSKGLALVKPKKHFLVPLVQPAEYVCEPNRSELMFDSIATHPTSSMILYNMDNFSGGTFDLLAGDNPVCYRDAQTLNFVRCQPNPWIVWSIAVCGIVGCEIIVTTHQSQILAHRGGRTQDIALTTFDKEGAIFQQRRGHPMEMIGSERYIIIVGGDVIYVFEPTMQFGGDLLAFKTSISFNGGVVEEPCPSLAIACVELPDLFCLVPRNNAVSIWRVGAEETMGHDMMAVEPNNETLDFTPIELKTFDTAVTFGNLALGERYVAGSADEDFNQDAKRIRIYNRNSGEEVHILQESDVPQEPTDTPTATQLEFVGDLLVSTSHFGHMLCVWHAQVGTLLVRYDTAISRGVSKSVYDYRFFHPVRSMVRLHASKSISFLLSVGPNLCLWSFPYDWRGEALTQNLANREKSFEACRNSFDFTQDPAAFGMR